MYGTNEWAPHGRSEPVMRPLGLEILVQERLGAVAVLVLAQEHGKDRLGLDAKAFFQRAADAAQHRLFVSADGALR